MKNWEPIETAPRDGTEIIVKGGTYGYQCAPCEFHNHQLKDPALAVHKYGLFIDPSDSCLYYLPTHWRPIGEES